MKDLYYILGVAKNAGPAEIDSAYRILSEKLKPTGNSGQFLQNHFIEITDAHEILSDPYKRKVYDAAFKRAHLRQLARFKAKTANVLIAGSVIIITGLTGFYLLILINTHKATKKVAAADSIAAVKPVKKHHRHKHHLTAHAKPILKTGRPIIKPVDKPLIAVGTKPAKPLIDTAKKSVKKPVLAAAVKPVAFKKDTLAKPKSLIITEGKHLILVNSITRQDSSYITYLKNNLRDSVYMHQLADYMSPVVSVLASNARVRVLEKGHSFYKVASNRQTGYIPKWALVKP